MVTRCADCHGEPSEQDPIVITGRHASCQYIRNQHATLAESELDGAYVRIVPITDTVDPDL